MHRNNNFIIKPPLTIAKAALRDAAVHLFVCLWLNAKKRDFL